MKVLQTKYGVKMSRLICNHICPWILRKDVKIMCFQSNLMNFCAVGWHMLRHSFSSCHYVSLPICTCKKTLMKHNTCTNNGKRICILSNCPSWRMKKKSFTIRKVWFRQRTTNPVMITIKNFDMGICCERLYQFWYWK